MKTTFHAVAVRSGDWWAIEITSGLPDDMLGVSQARRLTEVGDAARRVVADLLQIDKDDVAVETRVKLPSSLQAMVELFRDADIIEGAARTEAALARSHAAAALLDARLTMRETGQLLGVSHQRIKQLADRAPDAEPDDPMQRINTLVSEARRSRRAGLSVPDEGDSHAHLPIG